MCDLGMPCDSPTCGYGRRNREIREAREKRENDSTWKIKILTVHGMSVPAIGNGSTTVLVYAGQTKSSIVANLDNALKIAELILGVLTTRKPR